jgi:AcrR family transcriptional regulator
VRKRRSKEEAKAEILAIAQERLVEAGPDGLRLDDIAAEIGVSRQAVLHHFGSREGLLREVVRHAWLGLFEELRGLVQGPGELSPAGFIDRVDEVTRRKGNARLGAWLLLSGQGLPESLFEGALAELPAQAAGASDGGQLRDLRYGLLLAGAALFGDAIFGTRLRQALSLPDDEEARRDFHAWLAERLWP